MGRDRLSRQQEPHGTRRGRTFAREVAHESHRLAQAAGGVASQQVRRGLQADGGGFRKSDPHPDRRAQR